MFQFNYVDLGAGLPPAPIVMMNIYPPEWERSIVEDSCYSCTAKIWRSLNPQKIPQILYCPARSIG